VSGSSTTATQLGAAVTGTVACMWIADWNRARMAGDAAMVSRATAAMATAIRWPILREMAREGGWAQVLLGYAQASCCQLAPSRRSPA
jgi:hypothetical protein